MTGHVVIAGAAGAWGDSSLSTRQLLDDGRADYVVYEALAEVTMAVLARARAKDPTRGYAHDVVDTIARHLGEFRRRGMRVVTNAGGVNPEAAADVVRAAAEAAGLRVRVGVVTGDDLSARLPELASMASPELDSGAPLPGEALACNAYLGAQPIAAALRAGADVVVTGRVVDSALALGPLLHEFGWAAHEHDLLSAGSLAGHLVECGPQASGGLLTDWEDTAGWADPGYPIVEVARDGTFVVTTPPGTEGLVDARTVTEQLLYEIGDPTAYVLPDVVCDWSAVTVEEVGRDRVLVRGATGRAPTPTLKASAHVLDGHKATHLLFVGGRDAVAKGRRLAEDLLRRGQRMLAADGLEPFRATRVELLGSESTYGAQGRRQDTREVVVALGVEHADRRAVERFVREVPSIGLAGPPGVSGGGTGLPRVAPVIRLQSHLLPRQAVVARCRVDGVDVEVSPTPAGAPLRTTPPARQAPETEPCADPSADPSTHTVPLVALAHGRSGDKGPHVNVGVRARHRDFLPLLERVLTVERVGSWLSHLGAVAVERHELPGIHALNFVLHRGLGTASAASLRFDPQGKAVAQQLLDLPVRLPVALLEHPGIRRQERS